MAFDIIRRVLEEYFGYDVLYVMNITDVDDKVFNSQEQNNSGE
jgi:cysteinyl-tRNA synthetase